MISVKNLSEARRFITLIDTLYENKITTICLSDNQLDDVFSDCNNSSLVNNDNLLMDDLKISGSNAISISIFTGEEELFAFKRAYSRLVEMQSYKWLLLNPVQKLSI